jgi:hypothetical protein
MVNWGGVRVLRETPEAENNGYVVFKCNIHDQLGKRAVPALLSTAGFWIHI